MNPYPGYQFVVKWEGAYVAAVTHVSGLTRKTEVVSFRAGGQPPNVRKIPGQADHPPVRLERGITTDRAFERWANKVWDNTAALGNEISLEDFRKPLQIELYDEQGQIVLRYNLHNCWPSEYTALPELDSEGNTVALGSLTVEHEGWDRDESVSPPTPPTPPAD